MFLVFFSVYKQALALDDGGLYKERLEVSLRRLELRAQLYKQPDRAEDIAAMIIEQVITCTFIKTWYSKVAPNPRKYILHENKF